MMIAKLLVLLAFTIISSISLASERPAELALLYSDDGQILVISGDQNRLIDLVNDEEVQPLLEFVGECEARVDISRLENIIPLAESFGLSLEETNLEEWLAKGGGNTCGLQQENPYPKLN
jgi:hypothetical protein